MKRNFLKGLFTPALVLSLQAVLAAGPNATITTDNFNSRPGVRLSEVKGYLQGNCWFFADFDVNRSGWAPNMEGDGAMVSGTGASATERTGIYSPCWICLQLFRCPSYIALTRPYRIVVGSRSMQRMAMTNRSFYWIAWN